ncbi:hypothetical protein DRP04_00250 [Archaeoglobales archaeon]|nr:MAG: hypothetical protein DRP04_00250 [Archaeoglobales archaeon]
MYTRIREMLKNSDDVIEFIEKQKRCFKKMMNAKDVKFIGLGFFFLVDNDVLVKTIIWSKDLDDKT